MLSLVREDQDGRTTGAPDFPGAKDELTTSMKSVGEAMSIGRTFKEALQKGLRSMEIGATGLGFHFGRELPAKADVLESLGHPNSRRIFALRDAILLGISEEEIIRPPILIPGLSARCATLWRWSSISAIMVLPMT